MKFVIRKTGANLFLTCGKGKRFEWTTATKATCFDDVGAAASRAEKLGLDASEVMVEAVSS